jgi:hypothetical protein
MQTLELPQTKYRPKIIAVDPERIISYHTIDEVSFNLVLDYKTSAYVPPIPVIRAPRDLVYAGDYVNYNGHHRKRAAKEARVVPSCILLENWEDIAYLRDHPPRFHEEVYPELIESLGDIFEEHRDFIWQQARYFVRLQQIAAKKGITI